MERPFHRYFTYFVVLLVLMCILIVIWIFACDIKSPLKVIVTTSKMKPSNGIKYILIWTKNYTDPFKLLKSGNQAFIEAKCPISDCYITNDKEYLGTYTKFDAILFHGPEYAYKVDIEPTRRNIAQKYIFTSVESADNYPVCDETRDDFFNWTWTYKLNSDEVWHPLTIRNINGEIIGPKMDMEWIKHMEPVKDEIKKKFGKRRKAAAWFVSNCDTNSKREQYYEALQKELNQYGLNIDIFGDCGIRRCPKIGQTRQDCEDMLSRNYFFYLAFENSISEDYVTEKVLHGYKNHVVPIVYGGANYSRFLPPDSYINVLNTSVRRLAALINQNMKESEMYHEYFRWTNHYLIEASEQRPDSHQFCRFCQALHDQGRMEQMTVYKNFRGWWNGPRLTDICVT